MGKVISFELKKLVSRIGIYILVLLMAGLLVAGAFMYDPITRTDTSLSLIGETVSEMYSNFSNDGLKEEYLTIVEDTAINASTYVSTSNNYMKYNNKQEIDSLFTRMDEYCLQYYETTNASNAEYTLFLTGINESLNSLKTALNTALDYTKTSTGYYVLTTNKDYTKLYAVLNDITINFASPISHKVAGEKYYNEYREKLYNCLEKLVYPNLNQTATKYTTTGTYYAVITLRMDEIAYKMYQEQQKVISNPNLEFDQNIKDNMNALFNRYINCAKIFEQSYNSAMCVDALYSVKGKTNRANLVGYGNVSLYEQEELATENQYYIEHHCNESDFANSLSITHTSNAQTNAYDFSFFIMSLFAVLVIIFAIYLSANTISGEINNNTMRFTAMRPVKRGSLLIGKYLAIILISFIMLLFGAITSFIMGGIMYGFSSANILMIFNSSDVLVAHPMLVLTLFVLSLFLLICFYSALTIMLSTLIKSDLLTMIISVVFYIINLILPLFFGAGSWLKFYPFTNLNLFAYFGTNRMTTDSILAQLFNNLVYHGMNIWISLVYVIGITSLLLIIGKTIFKRREL